MASCSLGWAVLESDLLDWPDQTTHATIVCKKSLGVEKSGAQASPARDAPLQHKPQQLRGVKGCLSAGVQLHAQRSQRSFRSWNNTNNTRAVLVTKVSSLQFFISLNASLSRCHASKKGCKSGDAALRHTRVRCRLKFRLACLPTGQTKFCIQISMALLKCFIGGNQRCRPQRGEIAIIIMPTPFCTGQARGLNSI
eukprot:4040950-Pleurochrysis_carterae.AAC.4